MIPVLSKTGSDPDPDMASKNRPDLDPFRIRPGLKPDP
jgi:hypothetical protein